MGWLMTNLVRLTSLPDDSMVRMHLSVTSGDPGAWILVRCGAIDNTRCKAVVTVWLVMSILGKYWTR